jgi:hypothetical protein
MNKIDFYHVKNAICTVFDITPSFLIESYYRDCPDEKQAFVWLCNRYIDKATHRLINNNIRLNVNAKEIEVFCEQKRVANPAFKKKVDTCRYLLQRFRDKGIDVDEQI